jgi:SAM-dependent methyltransferase
MSVTCPACNSERVERIGSLPIFTPDYLGKPLDGPNTQSSLYRCSACELRFRSPMATEEELQSYYAGLADEDWWQYEGEREVWRYVRESLTNASIRNVLDVGCFRGDLLSYLGDGWEKFGVEPSQNARRTAQSRGIKVISDTIESLADTDIRFGAITMIDVIEHLPRPLDSLRKLANLLCPGGRLVIFTGTTDALSWRFARTHYWYCAMPEHVVFFRPSWFRWAAPRLGCTVESVRRLPFQRARPSVRLNEALGNVAYVSYKRLENVPVLGTALRHLPIVKRIGSWPGGWWTSARDHVLVTLVKQTLKGASLPS